MLRLLLYFYLIGRREIILQYDAEKNYESAEYEEQTRPCGDSTIFRMPSNLIFYGLRRIQGKLTQSVILIIETKRIQHMAQATDHSKRQLVGCQQHLKCSDHNLYHNLLLSTTFDLSISNSFYSEVVITLLKHMIFRNSCVELREPQVLDLWKLHKDY